MLSSVLESGIVLLRSKNYIKLGIITTTEASVLVGVCLLPVMFLTEEVLKH